MPPNDLHNFCHLAIIMTKNVTIMAITHLQLYQYQYVITIKGFKKSSNSTDIVNKRHVFQTVRRVRTKTYDNQVKLLSFSQNQPITA